ncbi:MAG: PmeII family type II restriction endonuclease [Candidatus Micrarchaeales archaeon]
MERTNLKDLLKKKNPYLFKAKNVTTANELVQSFLDAKLSSSEEEIIGAFLEELAIFVAEKKLNAQKASSSGIDFQYVEGDTAYAVSVKSGLNWGNSSQWKALEVDFKRVGQVLRQSRRIKHIEYILGVSYGNAPTMIKRGFIKQIAGQNFWYMLSGNKSFYKDMIEPIGYKAEELNRQFEKKKTSLVSKLTKEFSKDFCDKDGTILWGKLVEFNSGNFGKKK